MTTFIIFEDTPEFRQAYLTQVGEAIQENPPLTVDGRSCVGSSRITEEQQTILEQVFPEVVFTETAPEMAVQEGEIV